MFQDTMAVDMGSSYIKVLVGNKFKVKHCDMLKTPENSVADGRIINIDAVYEVLWKFIIEKNISAKYISFAIHGQDIIVRHIESPIMNEDALRSSIQFDIGQILPQNGENYYIDYEIIDKINSKEKKAYKLLVVAAPKDKVNAYIELTKKLNMKLKSIDVPSNCVTRVFKDFYKNNKTVHSIGIIDMGKSSSNFTIMEDGKLFIEKEVAFGINNVVREISKKFEIDENKAYEYFIANFEFTKINDQDELEFRIKTLFDNVFSSFEKIIQFYTSGKSEKCLDKIIIIGAGCQLDGLDRYMGKYFNTEVGLVWSTEDISAKTKFPKFCDFEYFVNALGLILKGGSSKEINIGPYELREKSIKYYKNEVYLVYTLIVILVLILGISLPKIYISKANRKLEDLNKEVNSGKASITENDKLRNEVNNSKSYVVLSKDVNKDNIKMANYISDIEEYVPKDLIFRSLANSKDQIIISGVSQNYNSINEFTANLQGSKRYRKASIINIKYDEKLSIYNYSITIDRVGGTNNGKSK